MTPALPPGFQIDGDPAAGGAAPPLPPGFQVDNAAAATTTPAAPTIPGIGDRAGAGVPATPDVQARNDRIARMKAARDSGSTTLTDKVVGGIEAGLSLVSQFTTAPLGMAGGFINGIVNRNPDLEGDVQQGGDALTYHPKGDLGVPGTKPLDPATQQRRADIGTDLVEDAGGVLGEAAPLLGHNAEMHIAAAHAAPAAGQVARAAGTGAADVVAHVLPKVDTQVARVADKALQHEIPVRPDQLGKSPMLQKAGQFSEQIPLAGSKADERTTRFNTALVRLVDPDNTTDTKLAPDTFNDAMNKAGSTIGDIAGSAEIPLDADTSKALATHLDNIDTQTPEVRAINEKYVQKFQDAADPQTGVIPGDAWRTLDSQLTRQMRSTPDGDLRDTLSDLHETFLDALQKNISPDDADTFQTARKQYAIGKTLEPLVAKSVDGNITPQSLLGRVAATQSGKRALANGRAGDLGDLAKLGKLLQDPASSGTAERNLLYKVVSGAGGALTTTGAAAAAHGTLGGSAALPFAVANLYNRAGPAISRAMIRRALKNEPKAPVPEARVAPEPPEDPTTSLGAGGGGGGGPGGPPAGPLGDLTPDWGTTPGAGGGTPRGGHEPGLVRSVDETDPLPQGNPPKPGSQIPVHTPAPLGDLTPMWSTSPGAGGARAAAGVEGTPAIEPQRMLAEPSADKRAGREIPAVPGRPDLPDTITSGPRSEQALDEKTGELMKGRDATLARQPAPEPAKPLVGATGEVAKVQAEHQAAIDAAAAEKVKAEKQAVADAEAAKKRDADIADLENAAHQTEDRALQARLIARANALRKEPVPVGKVIEGQPEITPDAPKKIPVGKATEGQPEITPGGPKKIKAGEATEVTPEAFAEAEKAWRKQFDVSDAEADRVKAAAVAYAHDPEAVKAAAVQHENSPRAFDREVARITEEGEARANESQQGDAGSARDAVGDDGVPGAEAGQDRGKLDGDAAVPAAGGDTGPDGAAEAGHRVGSEASPASRQEASTGKPDAGAEGSAGAGSEGLGRVGPFKQSREAFAEAKRLTDTTGVPHSAKNIEHVDAEGYTVGQWFAEPDAPAVAKSGGMTLEEAKAHVAQANIDRPIGGTWDDINRMQGGKLRGVEKLTAEKPPAAPTREARVVKVTNDPLDGRVHHVQIDGDSRTFEINRADNGLGGPTWSLDQHEHWAQGPAQSQNGFVSNYLGDTKAEALKNLPDMVDRFDKSPGYKKAPTGPKTPAELRDYADQYEGGEGERADDYDWSRRPMTRDEMLRMVGGKDSLERDRTAGKIQPERSDLTRPAVAADGHLWDGVHRVVSALLQDKTIDVVEGTRKEISPAADAKPGQVDRPELQSEAEFGAPRQAEHIADLKQELADVKAGRVQTGPFSKYSSKASALRQIVSAIDVAEHARPENFASDHLAEINKAMREGRRPSDENIKRYQLENQNVPDAQPDDQPGGVRQEAGQEDVPKADDDEIFKANGKEEKTRTPIKSADELDGLLRAKFGDKLVDGLKDQGILRYARNEDEQPQGTPRERIGGLFKTKPGEKPNAVLYYDRLSAEQAPGVLMHELGEHFGIVRLLGQERYNIMLNDLSKLKNTPEVRKAWDRVKKNYVGPNTVSNLTTDHPSFLREVAAHLCETEPDLPFVRRMVNEVRAFLYEKFGTSLGNKVDANLIRGLAASALRKASKGELPMVPKPVSGGSVGIAPTPAKTFKPMLAPRETAPAPLGRPQPRSDGLPPIPAA